MDDRLALLESKVAALARAVAEIERQLAAAERSPAAPSPVAPAGESSRSAELTDFLGVTAGPAPARAPTEGVIGHLALIGRGLMVLAGAYLLRALTEGEIVPQAGGVALGLAYAVLWLVLGDRAAARGRALSAAYHAGAACVVADPLLWEAASRFGVLTAPQAAAVLALFAASGLAVTWRRRLPAVA